VSLNFTLFEKFFPGVKKVQLVKELGREKTYANGMEIRAVHKWLAAFAKGRLAFAPRWSA
jgi:uncharacterized protein